MRLLLAACLSLALAGCASIQAVTGASVPANQVAAAIVSFDAAQDAATVYLHEKTCVAGQTPLANACKTRAGVLLLARDVPIGRKARDDLWIASGNGTRPVGARGLLTAVLDATAVLSSDVKVSQ